MNFRITSNGMFRNYRNNLYKNKNNMNKAMEAVQTQRQFNTYAEDPASASRAFQLRRSLWRTEDQLDNSNYIIGKYEVAFAALEPVVDSNGEGNDLSGIKASLEALSDTAGSSRRVLGRNLQTVASSIAKIMNVKNVDEYVFGGADGLNVPFEWDGDKGCLTYQGMDVNKIAYDPQRNVMTYQANEGEDPIVLKSQATYMDIGLGMQTDANGEIIPSSAFDSSLSGLKFLNYGVDEEGDPKNLIVAMFELGSIFARCDKDEGQFASAEDREAALRLMPKVRDAITYTAEQHLDLSSQTIFLDENRNLLKHERDNLDEEIVNTEDRDGAEAIMSMVYAQYSYNAAMRIGNGILSQSLLDYMG